MESIKHAFYINLDSRKDRKELVEIELKNIGINATRFNAIKMKNGAIGCTMSHLHCLQTAKSNGWDHLLIVEDDIKFLDPILFKHQFGTFLTNQKEWDVVLLAGNNMPPYEKIGNYCIKLTQCQTTTGYMVNGHYFDTLINNIKAGLKLLMHDPKNHFSYAIDKYWFSLQKTDNWFLITPLTVSQRKDYSDIEEKQTDYTHLMLDLDKKSFFIRQMEQIKAAMTQVAFTSRTSKEQIEKFQQLQKMKTELEERMKFFEQ
jgi:GR25 family glycosyltransferase involved in LPS biosynthesis